MKGLAYGVALVVLMTGVAVGQSQGIAPASSLSSGSRGMVAMQHAAAAQKYVFLFFWKDQNPQTAQMWKSLEAAAANMADRVVIVPVSVSDPAEKAIVDRYDISRAPLPLALSVAPCGAITKAFRDRIDENLLRTALVSPCAEKCMKALQDRKLVLLCAQRSTIQFNLAAIEGVQDLKADPQYGQVTEVVYLNTAEPAEASFLKGLQIDPQTPNPITVFLAPPGTIVGKFEGTVTKDQLLAKLASAQSGGCPGGKCGPGGCGPKR